MDSIILASKSPRRRDILQTVRIPFIVYNQDVQEELGFRRYIKSSVINVSKLKAEAALSAFSKGLILGVDTVVYFNGRVLGKPRDVDEACAFLRMLSGNRHQVFSGITLKDAQSRVSYSSCSISEISFSELTRDEIRRYIELGEWVDKAGGYAVQGQAALYISRISGSFFNVMGLPVEELFRLLKRFSYFESDGVYRPVMRR